MAQAPSKENDPKSDDSVKHALSQDTCREWIMKDEWKPNVILLINPSQATRFAEYLKLTNSHDEKFNIIETQFPKYIFVQCSDQVTFCQSLWNDEIVNKFLHLSHIIDHITQDINFIVKCLLEMKDSDKNVYRIVGDKKMIPLLGNLIPRNIELHPSKFSHVIFVHKAYSRYYFGIHPKCHYFNEISFKIKENLRTQFKNENCKNLNQISRAYFKLNEIFLRCKKNANKKVKINNNDNQNKDENKDDKKDENKDGNRDENKNENQNENDNSIDGYFDDLFTIKEFKGLDVGASPGGWTKCLLDYGCFHVCSVDPGNILLDKESMVKVRHLQKTIEQCTLQLSTMPKFDIIVCDMNMAPLKAVKVLIDLSKFLNDKGFIVFTLKLHNKIRKNRENSIQDCEIQLEKAGFTSFHLLWLMANKALERTLIARKK